MECWDSFRHSVVIYSVIDNLMHDSESQFEWLERIRFFLHKVTSTNSALWIKYSFLRQVARETPGSSITWHWMRLRSLGLCLKGWRERACPKEASLWMTSTCQRQNALIIHGTSRISPASSLQHLLAPRSTAPLSCLAMATLSRLVCILMGNRAVLPIWPCTCTWLLVPMTANWNGHAHGDRLL